MWEKKSLSEDDATRVLRNMKTIIIDLDGTLADVGHRLHHLEGKKKKWGKFFASMHLDPVNEWCRELLLAMKSRGHKISLVSGRPSDYKEVVEKWLQDNKIPYDELLMRKEGDFRADNIVKKEILDAHFHKDDILFVVDDRESVVTMWREEGLVCLQCNPHEANE